MFVALKTTVITDKKRLFSRKKLHTNLYKYNNVFVKIYGAIDY